MRRIGEAKESKIVRRLRRCKRFVCQYADEMAMGLLVIFNAVLLAEIYRK